MARWGPGRRERRRQAQGPISAAILADFTFDLDAVSWPTTHARCNHRPDRRLVATGALTLLIFALVRTERTRYAPAAIGVYTGAAY
ncbi:hypothetical protein Asi02nite_48030 [Asanoa siamensis]|uniref:Uncharacterized protein n=1 Tax=Asanoa siamensis TaxID=926357 RepID=A0ABQ4CVI0_9ACTN|nr:hypothetical protein Asi02nite_48030 [Asanoa siamensis]